MEIFEKIIDELRNYLNDQSKETTLFNFEEEINWKKDEKNNIVMKNDTAIELGHPSTESVCFLAWTEKNEPIKHGQISLIGKDVNSIKDVKTSFGEIVLIRGHGFNEENTFERYLEMDIIKRIMHLKGYMIRAAPQRMRQWSRISKEAVREGFSFKVLGNEMIRKYMELEYVDAVEIIFITSEKCELNRLKALGEKATKYIHAMNKMLENLEYDCRACDFQDVCDEVGELRQMHKKLQES